MSFNRRGQTVGAKTKSGVDHTLARRRDAEREREREREREVKRERDGEV